MSTSQYCIQQKAIRYPYGDKFHLLSPCYSVGFGLYTGLPQYIFDTNQITTFSLASSALPSCQQDWREPLKQYDFMQFFIRMTHDYPFWTILRNIFYSVAIHYSEKNHTEPSRMRISTEIDIRFGGKLICVSAEIEFNFGGSGYVKSIISGDYTA